MKLLLVLAAAIGVAVADLHLCHTEMGNGAYWLGVDITQGEVVEFAHQGERQGPNFCYGHTEEGFVEVDFYTDLTCFAEHDPGKKFEFVPKNQPECGAADEGAMLCVDNQVRAVARTVASSTTTAEEFARLFAQVIQPRKWAIFVAKVTGDVEISVATFTDENVCILTADDRTGTAKFVIAAAKLGQLDDTAPYERTAEDKKPLLSATVAKLKGKQTRNVVQELGAKCQYELDTYHGDFWTALMATGVDQAVRVGDGYIGENNCVDDRRGEGLFDLAYFVRADLFCDDVPEETAKNSKATTVKISTVHRSLGKAGGRQHVPPELPPAACLHDANAITCPDVGTREFIHRLLAVDVELSYDPYAIAKLVQQRLEGDGHYYSVLAMDLLEDGAIMRQDARTDAHLCFVGAYSHNGEYIVVSSAKLDF